VLLTHRPAVYYGWPMLVGMSVAQMISWGILDDSFAVFLQPMEAELGWSRTTLTGAFSLALLVSGCAGVPVGHWLDARGPRGLMSAGSALSAALLVGWSQATTVPAFYAAWAGLGLCMAAVLYEPAFAVIAVWFVRHRHRALTVMTLFGGLASTIFVPLAAALSARLGWRPAVLILALILAGTTLPLHALLLRRHPGEVGALPDGASAPPPEAGLRLEAPANLRAILTSGAFWRLAVSFSLSSFATVAAVVHLIPALQEDGLSATEAAAALAVLGAMQLPGRLLFGPLRGRVSGPRTRALVFLTQAAALALLAAFPHRSGVVAFVLLFGMAAGMSTVVRASAVGEEFALSHYGRVGGTLSMVTTFARASGPVAASLAHAAWPSYGYVFAGLAAVMVTAAGVAASRAATG
jgi:MFS family permease